MKNTWNMVTKFKIQLSSTYKDPKGQLHTNFTQKSEEHGEYNKKHEEYNTKWLGGPTHKRMGLDYDQPILAQLGGRSTLNQGQSSQTASKIFTPPAKTKIIHWMHRLSFLGIDPS